jgi:adenine-specific DNA-methyltransferase
MDQASAPESTASTPPGSVSLESFQKLFPGALRDGVLDAVQLGEILGVDVAGLKDGKERFGLMWAGKKRAADALQVPSYAALISKTAEVHDMKDARNAFIAGDNLEVLKLLQNAYNDQVKMIYIDPPYNTGNDFVYNDDFSDPLKHYLEVTGQIDAEGNRLIANTEVSGRKHSNWLSMMYPRLVLARNLLTQDGLIFVSIDDNEMASLKLLMDEIFGAENFVANFVWVSNLKGRQISGAGPAGTKEYVLTYARNILNVDDFRASATQLKKVMPSVYKGFDFKVQTDDHGPYVLKNELHNTNSAFNEITRPNLVFDIYYNPKTGKVLTENHSDQHIHPEFAKISPKKNNNGVHKFHAFRWGRPKVESETFNLEFVETASGWKVYTKVRDVDSTSVKDLFMDITTSSGSDDLARLGLDAKLFDYPKPVSLIQTLIAIGTEKDSLVLDFFAGSGTTGHAVAAQNAIDGGERKYLLVTIDEQTDEKSFARSQGFSLVSDIAEKRLEAVEAQFSAGGLRSFKLAQSTFAAPAPSADSYLFTESSFRLERTREEVIQEVLLHLGVPLSAPIIEIKKGTLRAWISGNVLVHNSGDLSVGIVDAAKENDCSVLVVFEDDLAAKDALKANLFFAAKKANITMKTF